MAKECLSHQQLSHRPQYQLGHQSPKVFFENEVPDAHDVVSIVSSHIVRIFLLGNSISVWQRAVSLMLISNCWFSRYEIKSFLHVAMYYHNPPSRHANGNKGSALLVCPKKGINAIYATSLSNSHAIKSFFWASSPCS